MPEALLEQFYRRSASLVEELEPYLLELEVADEQADSELLGRILRVVTSVRMGAGLLGEGRLLRLARLLEIVLERLRSGSLQLAHEGVRTILRGCSVLAAIAGNEDASRYDDAVAALEALAQSHMSSEGMFDPGYPICFADGKPIMHLSGYELEQCGADGAFLYMLTFNLHADIGAKDITPLDLLEFLQKSGHVIATHCECDLAAAVCCETDIKGILYVLFSSILEQDLVEAVFMLDSRQIQALDVLTLASGTLSLTADERLPDDVAVVYEQQVTDAPIEGLDELMEEFDRAMAEMRERSHVPFEPWDGSDAFGAGIGPLPASASEKQDIFDSIVDDVESSILKMANGSDESGEEPAAPSLASSVASSGRDPFGDLAPVDELIDDESPVMVSVPEDDTESLLAELLGEHSGDASGMASSIAHAAGDLFVQDDIDAVFVGTASDGEPSESESDRPEPAESAADLLADDGAGEHWPDMEEDDSPDDSLLRANEADTPLADDLSDDNPAVLTLDEKLALSETVALDVADEDEGISVFPASGDDTLFAGGNSGGSASGGESGTQDASLEAGYPEGDQSQLAALEAEFEAALLEEARAAGILVPDEASGLDMKAPTAVAEQNFSNEAYADSGIGAAADRETDPDADPDADLFMDSGNEPDLSYLNPAREEVEGGVVLAMEGQTELLHGFTVTADESRAVVNLAGDVTVAAAESVRDLLLDLMQEHAAIELDMRETQSTDISFIQLLIAASRFAAEHGVQLTLRGGHAGAAGETFSQCGLSDEVRARLSLSSVFVA
jgi:anti-anti-sigma regulatory factor